MAETVTVSDQRRNATNIPISLIRHALHTEWSDLSAAVQEQTGEPPLRASTSTLVVVTRKGSEASLARESLHQLASTIPSRVIVFIVDPDTENPVASVWAHCTLTSRGKHAGCYDVIEISIPPDRLEAVPNIVAMHRLGELPTFVFWTGEADIESPVFGQISTAANRLIIDSERFNDPLEALQRYAMFLGTTGTAVLGSDLGWTRIKGWRELIAQSFESPATRSMATNVLSADIVYDDVQISGAILLGSWIAACTGYQPSAVRSDPSTSELRCVRDGSSGMLSIKLTQSHQSGSGIRSIRIRARRGAATARVSIFRGDGHTSTVRIESTGMPRQERIVRHLDAHQHELIAAELNHFSRDSMFEESLAIATQFHRLTRKDGQ